MGFQFLQPLALLLLLLLPWFWWTSRRLRGMAPGRRWTVRVLRTLIVLCFVFALSQMELVRRSKDLMVFFVLDESDSVPAEQRLQAYDLIRSTTRRMKANDQAGLIVFGSEPSIEFSAARQVDFTGELRSAVSTQRTNIAAALRLALAAFPPETMKRIVLLSDGNENEGSAVEVARLARGNGIPVDVAPLRYRDRQDLQVSKVVAPQQSMLEAPFDVKVFVEARANTQARLRLFQSAPGPSGHFEERLVAEKDVEVYAGKKNLFVLPRRLAEGGFHTFRATIEPLAGGDARPENNSALGFTFVKSRPRALYIEGDEAGINYLLPALRAQDIEVTAGGTDLLPASLQELQNYDTLILSNVPASDLGASQMAMIEQAVHSLGIGLVMIGGENSFGAGGYQDTPIEKALPVSMDIKQKKVLPNGALAIVLHTCEIPAGNSWAREISIAALNVLSRQDYFGLLFFGPPVTQVSGFGGWAERWAWEPGLQQTGDKRKMRSIIRSVQPGDMPTFDPTLELAYRELRSVKAQAKHIIIISDGDPAPPNRHLANAIRDEGISISTVVIAPHDPSTAETMKALAFWGGGNFYYPKSSTELPRIFIKEATIVRRSLINEQSFTPQPAQYSEILTGISAAPPLHGHVITTLKPLATLALATAGTYGGGEEVEVDPVLAHWRYGLGKTVAFTSDAKNKWARDWAGGWGEFAKFWAQAVRWSMRETSSSNYQAQTDITGGKGTVIIDALDDAGNFENFVEFEGTVVAQTPDGVESFPLDVRQIAPGRYQASFPATSVGSYMVSLVSKKDGESQLLTGGVALSYSPEYQVSRSNDALLTAIAEASGGQLIEQPDRYSPFRHDLPSGRRHKPLWPLLTLLGFLLLPVDIFVRRVYLDWAEIGAWLAAKAGAIFGNLRPARGAEADTRMSALKGAKARATGGAEGEMAPSPAAAATAAVSEDQRRAQAAARAALRERIASAAPAASSVFEAPAPGGGPARPRGKETFAAEEPGAPGRPGAPPVEGGFTGSLLEAKRRAKKKQK